MDKPVSDYVPMLSLRFGALAPKIREQLKEQKFPVTASVAKAYQDVADAITILAVHGYIPERVRDKARQKLVKTIASHRDARGSGAGGK